MNYSSIKHRATYEFSYVLDSETIVIKLQTGKDVNSVKIYYEDPFKDGYFDSSNKWIGFVSEVNSRKELKYSYIWNIQISPIYKRLKYFFEINNEIYYFENGFIEKDKVNTIALNYFINPWMNEIDIFTTPKWVSEVVWYQIFPDRFCNVGNKGYKEWNSKEVKNEDIYGGNIKGIISKLDYIKNLGFNGIYLTPIFLAESTHKYDTTDYYEIDPLFGTKEDLKDLVNKCHEKGIKIMLDGVFNHTGKSFKYWLDVLEKGDKSDYFDFFMVNSLPIDKNKDHTYDKEFYSFAFTTSMPKLNTSNKKVIDYIVNICKYYCNEFGIDAWRLDVANEISHALCKEIRKVLKEENKDVYILGEIWHDSLNWLHGDELDSVMNYPLTNAINNFWFDKNKTKEEFMYSINSCYEMYFENGNNCLFNLLDSHDTNRIINRVNFDKNVFLQQLTLLLIMPGSPCMFYGTEVMLEGESDPHCRVCMPWIDIENNKNADVTEIIKELIKIRKTYKDLIHTDMSFTNLIPNSRVLEIVRGSLKIIINASGKEIIYTNNNNIIFSYNYDNNRLLEGSVLIFSI